MLNCEVFGESELRHTSLSSYISAASNVVCRQSEIRPLIIDERVPVRRALCQIPVLSRIACVKARGGLKIAITVADSSEEGAVSQRLARLKLHSTILFGIF